jgi:hypothetical protein
VAPFDMHRLIITALSSSDIITTSIEPSNAALSRRSVLNPGRSIDTKAMTGEFFTGPFIETSTSKPTL